jgi:hypothetical protein
MSERPERPYEVVTRHYPPFGIRLRTSDLS